MVFTVICRMQHSQENAEGSSPAPMGHCQVGKEERGVWERVDSITGKGSEISEKLGAAQVWVRV